MASADARSNQHYNNMNILKIGFFGAVIASSFLNTSWGGGISGAPAPFDRGGVKIALVSYLSQGDYFEAFEAGVARQAKALGVDLRIFQGKQDAAQQRDQIEQAISHGVNGLIVSHGQPESLKDVIQKALDAGIKVVAKDIDLGNPKVPLISQNDHEIPPSLRPGAAGERYQLSGWLRFCRRFSSPRIKGRSVDRY